MTFNLSEADRDCISTWRQELDLQDEVTTQELMIWLQNSTFNPECSLLGHIEHLVGKPEETAYIRAFADGFRAGRN